MVIVAYMGFEIDLNIEEDADGELEVNFWNGAINEWVLNPWDLIRGWNFSSEENERYYTELVRFLVEKSEETPQYFGDIMNEEKVQANII